MQVNNQSPGFGTRMMLGKSTSTVEFSKEGLQEIFKDSIHPADMNRFQSQIIKFKTFLAYDLDPEHMAVIQPKADKIHISTTYGAMLTGKNDYEPIRPIQDLGQRLVRRFMNMSSGVPSPYAKV